jgi:hypothetical protein
MKKFYFLLIFIFPALSPAQSVKTYIPEKAHQYLPLVYKESKRLMPSVPTPAYFGGLIEQESCISLKHSRCWSPTSTLNTKREFAIGFGQITKAFRDDGSTRFDSLTDMRNRYRTELSEMSWNNLANRPDLQIRAAILMIREGYTRFAGVPDKMARLQMADAAYNGGVGGTLKERTACGLAKGCDPNLWFDNVENYCLKSKKAIYGNRSPCLINREHPDLIFHLRLPKYQLHYEDYQRKVKKA